MRQEHRALTPSLSRLARSAAVFGGGTMAGQVVGALLLPVYTPYLSPADYGVVEVATVTTSLAVALLVLGLDNALFRFAFDADTELHRRAVAATTMAALGITAMAGLVGIVSMTPLLSRALLGPAGDPRVARLVGLAVFVSVASVVPRSLFRINGQDALFGIFSVANVAVSAALGVLLVVFMGYGPVGVVAATAGSGLIMLAVMFYAQRNHILGGAVSWALLVSMLRFSLPVVPAGLSLWVLTLADRYFLRYFSTMTEVGLYAVGAKLASPVSLFTSAFQLAWPQFAFSVLTHDDAKAIYARVLTYFALVSAFLVVALSLYSAEVLRLITPANYWPASKVVLPLTLGLVLYGSYYIFAIGFHVVKNMRSLPTITVVPSMVNLVLNLLLTPRQGMMGAAYATLASYLLMALLAWRFCQRVYPIRYEWRRVLALLLISAVALVLGWPAGRLELIPAMVVKSFVMVAWVAAGWFGVLLEPERVAILRRWEYTISGWARPVCETESDPQR